MNLHTFEIDLDWKLINSLSKIDRFGGVWIDISKREGQTLRQLKSIATVRSVGASTRIEGAKMTDKEVEVLIDNLKIEKLEERDQQEVIGYFEALDLISEAYADILISESTIQSLHNVLMKYSTKDEWHKGRYKQLPNSVEATRPDGSKYTVFETTAPGWPTEDAVRKLIAWYNQDKETHSLVRVAVFVYDFLSIHPFQDGNGRLSRLLSTLLLLKEGYGWIEYVSFEHEIEHRKSDYYKILMECQGRRPGENISAWVLFFTDCLTNIQQLLIRKLDSKEENNIVNSPRIEQIRMFVEHHAGVRTGDIALKLGIPLPTVKKEVAAMVASGLLIRHGSGAGTHYTSKPRMLFKSDQMFKLGKKENVQSFQLIQAGSSRIIKKIILLPLFEWTQPDEWVGQLHRQGLYLEIQCISRREETYTLRLSLPALNNPYLFRPVFTLHNSVVIPNTIIDRTPYQYEYPIEINISLKSSIAIEEVTFDVMLVYDEWV